MSPHQTSNTTSNHHTSHPQKVTKHNPESQERKIENSTHPFITIRRSGAAAPSSANAPVLVISEWILSGVSILWGWGGC
jgi:hypothetical protein